MDHALEDSSPEDRLIDASQILRIHSDIYHHFPPRIYRTLRLVNRMFYSLLQNTWHQIIQMEEGSQPADVSRIIHSLDLHVRSGFIDAPFWSQDLSLITSLYISGNLDSTLIDYLFSNGKHLPNLLTFGLSLPPIFTCPNNFFQALSNAFPRIERLSVHGNLKGSGYFHLKHLQYLNISYGNEMPLLLFQISAIAQLTMVQAIVNCSSCLEISFNP